MAAKKKQPGRKPTGKKPSREQQREDLRERLYKGLTHPLRYRILTLLNDRQWSPNELSEELPEGLSQVSYHVKVLCKLDLIELTETRPARGAVEHFYKAVERPIIDLDMARDMPRSGRHIVIGGILEEINEDVNESIRTGAFDSRPDYHCARFPMLLTDRTCKRAHKIGDKYLAEMMELAEEASDELSKSDNPEAIGVTAVLLVFPSPMCEREKAPTMKKLSDKRKEDK